MILLATTLTIGTCLPLPVMLDRLEAQYSEQAFVTGPIDGTQGLTMVLTVSKTGTYSILNVNSGGVACIASAGSKLQAVPQGEPA